MMWPNADTAFLVIHGAGPHRPFEALDPFARGVWNVLKEQNPGIHWQHRLRRRKDWIENYVSLALDGKPTIDFYEYYWDCYIVHKVTGDEAIDWLARTSAGAKEFYKEQPKLAKKYQDLGIDLFKDGEFRSNGYVRVLLGSLAEAPLLRPLVPLLENVPRVGPILKAIIGWVSKLVIGYLNDIAIYTTADPRSDHYEVREKVLSGAVEELSLLLENKDQEKDYQRIIVVGHSLGSVIGYDALNRINHDMNVSGGISEKVSGKIAGFVTFGSPLDKITFYFREQVADDNFVQSQILEHFHGFKRLPPPKCAGPTIECPTKPFLDGARWLNFWHRGDWISGSLDAYAGVENIECKESARGVGKAHKSYWTSDHMYHEIAEAFLK